LRSTLARLCRLLSKSPALETAQKPESMMALPAPVASGADTAAAATPA
jgi:acetyl-CoA carboxylase carboxyl transferase subunit beta